MSTDDEPTRDQWYADDFETTTDLDGPAVPYTPTEDEVVSIGLALAPGGSVTRVRPKGKNGRETATIRYTRSESGELTATRRTGRVRVWSWAIAAVGETTIYRGTTIEGWVAKAAELGGIHWFHNLRFDGAFMDAYFQDVAPHGLAMHPGTWRPSQVPTASFSALISDTGAHYSRNIRMYDGRTFEVRDSLKKFPATTIARLAEMFGAPNPKGEIDYEAERPVGYRPTPEEWSYLETDVEILRTALLAAFEAGATGLTIGGDAIREYRRTMEHGKFRAVYPLLDRETDEHIRMAYRGGWTYVNPEHQGTVIEGGQRALHPYFPSGIPRKGQPIGEVYDVNSMYPAVMRQEAYPYGVPVQLAPGQLTLDGYPHTIVGALLDATIKPGRFPIIQVKKDARYNPVQYQTHVEGIEWFGTEVDWRLLFEQYDVRIHEWISGLAFQSMSGLFNAYIDKWMEVKATATGGARTQAKFQLNNLWGRFAINPLRAGRVPDIDPDGTPLYVVQDQEYDEPCYTAVGVWTTSYGRDRVIRAAQSFGSAFLSADTDSVHKLGIGAGGLTVHESALGAWKRESQFTKATYLRAKAYAEEIDGEVEAHVAGLPRHLLEGASIEDVRIGAKFSGKLVPKRVPGGIILESTDFEIGERDAWGHMS